MLHDTNDKYHGMLTITHAELVDAGIYTCQVVDGEQQQCRSIRVNVSQIPDVKISPLNVIVEKVSSLKSVSIRKKCR